jgi:hypothetical protein
MEFFSNALVVYATILTCFFALQAFALAGIIRIIRNRGTMDTLIAIISGMSQAGHDLRRQEERRAHDALFPNPPIPFPQHVYAATENEDAEDNNVSVENINPGPLPVNETVSVAA